MKKRIKKSLFITLIMLLITAVVRIISGISPALTERFYSTTVFPVLSFVLGNISGIFPFSIIEIIYILLVIAVISFMVYCAIRLYERKSIIKELLYIPLVLSVIILGFAILCMPNYLRLPIETQYPFEMRKYSIDELVECTEYLIGKANNISQQVKRDTTGDLLLPGGYKALAKESVIAFNDYTSVNTNLPKVYSRPKPILFSELMSHLRLTGFYSPYTAEPNVNKNAPKLDLPATMCHELAHTAGIMREEEANFLAYISAVNSNFIELQYSGYILAITHLTNAVYSQNYDAFLYLDNLYSSELSSDLEVIREYWRQYDGIAAEISETVNNAYLKINNQDEGTKSYGMVVDLIIAEYLHSSSN